MGATHQGCTKENIKMASKERLWLRVITVADLANDNGCTIDPNKLNDSWRGKSNLNWPKCAMQYQKMRYAIRGITSKNNMY